MYCFNKFMFFYYNSSLNISFLKIQLAHIDISFHFLFLSKLKIRKFKKHDSKYNFLTIRHNIQPLLFKYKIIIEDTIH